MWSVWPWAPSSCWRTPCSLSSSGGLLRAAGLVGAGYLVGEAVSIATNRKRGAPFQVIAVVGFVASYAVFELLTSGLLVRDLYTIVGFIIGLALAVGRVR